MDDAGHAIKEIRLFRISFLVLFLEVALIRWMPAYIRLLSYFSNFILLASFLGIGVGCLLAGLRRNLFAFFPPLLFALGIGALALPFGGAAYAAGFSYVTVVLLVTIGLRALALPGLFARRMSGFWCRLGGAASDLGRAYDDLKREAGARLGALFDASDSPPSLEDLFGVEWDFPDVAAPYPGVRTQAALAQPGAAGGRLDGWGGLASLHDGLDYLDLLAEVKPEKLEPAASRWHGRLELEASVTSLAESQLALAALASLCAGERDAIGLLKQVARRVRPTLHRVS